MSKVFITHEQNRFDYSPAECFGQLVAVSERVYSFTPGNTVNPAIHKSIVDCSNAFDPGVDYVLPSGSAIMTSMFMVRLAAIGIRTVRIVRWNNNDGAYNIGTLDLSPLIGN